ncbi:MAG: hypothetical protein B6I22_02130 [Desulfobacteraceae bacterium 4572_123]|nr:MAG: hypothetical protein B6I22_02130 [Desulfobacteraceae bacterium 4572_123]
MQKRFEIDLDQYESDFAELQDLEQDLLSDLERVEKLEFWEPTKYERYYLPGLRLAGIKDKTNNVILNTADLHVHTQWSDGDDLDRVLEQAVAMRLDAIAITDHDEIKGAFEARRRVHQRRMPLTIVPGCEVSSRDGHIGALFVMKRFPKNLSAAETVHLIHEAGGIAVAHHPYSPRWLDSILRVRLGCGDLIKKVPFDAVECTNAVPGSGVKYNIAAIEAMHRHHIPIAVTGSSDAHVARFVGKGKTYYGGNQGVVSLRNSLVNGFTQGSEGYWKTREKVVYYAMLVLAIIKNIYKKTGSVN